MFRWMMNHRGRVCTTLGPWVLFLMVFWLVIFHYHTLGQDAYRWYDPVELPALFRSSVIDILVAKRKQVRAADV